MAAITRDQLEGTITVRTYGGAASKESSGITIQDVSSKIDMSRLIRRELQLALNNFAEKQDKRFDKKNRDQAYIVRRELDSLLSKRELSSSRRTREVQRSELTHYKRSNISREDKKLASKNYRSKAPRQSQYKVTNTNSYVNRKSRDISSDRLLTVLNESTEHINLSIENSTKTIISNIEEVGRAIVTGKYRGKETLLKEKGFMDKLLAGIKKMVAIPVIGGVYTMLNGGSFKDAMKNGSGLGGAYLGSKVGAMFGFPGRLAGALFGYFAGKGFFDDMSNGKGLSRSGKNAASKYFGLGGAALGVKYGSKFGAKGALIGGAIGGLSGIVGGQGGIEKGLTTLLTLTSAVGGIAAFLKGKKLWNGGGKQALDALKNTNGSAWDKIKAAYGGWNKGSGKSGQLTDVDRAIGHGKGRPMSIWARINLLHRRLDSASRAIGGPRGKGRGGRGGGPVPLGGYDDGYGGGFGGGNGGNRNNNRRRVRPGSGGGGGGPRPGPSPSGGGWFNKFKNIKGIGGMIAGGAAALGGYMLSGGLVSFASDFVSDLIPGQQELSNVADNIGDSVDKLKDLSSSLDSNGLFDSLSSFAKNVDVPALVNNINELSTKALVNGIELIQKMDFKDTITKVVDTTMTLGVAGAAKAAEADNNIDYRGIISAVTGVDPSSIKVAPEVAEGQKQFSAMMKRIGDNATSAAKKLGDNLKKEEKQLESSNKEEGGGFFSSLLGMAAVGGLGYLGYKKFFQGKGLGAGASNLIGAAGASGKSLLGGARNLTSKIGLGNAIFGGITLLPALMSGDRNAIVGSAGGMAGGMAASHLVEKFLPKKFSGFARMAASTLGYMFGSSIGESAGTSLFGSNESGGGGFSSLLGLGALGGLGYLGYKKFGGTKIESAEVLPDGNSAISSGQLGLPPGQDESAHAPLQNGKRKGRQKPRKGSAKGRGGPPQNTTEISSSNIVSSDVSSLLGSGLFDSYFNRGREEYLNFKNMTPEERKKYARRMYKKANVKTRKFIRDSKVKISAWYHDKKDTFDLLRQSQEGRKIEGFYNRARSGFNDFRTSDNKKEYLKNLYSKGKTGLSSWYHDKKDTFDLLMHSREVQNAKGFISDKRKAIGGKISAWYHDKKDTFDLLRQSQEGRKLGGVINKFEGLYTKVSGNFSKIGQNFSGLFSNVKSGFGNLFNGASEGDIGDISLDADGRSRKGKGVKGRGKGLFGALKRGASSVGGGVKSLAKGAGGLIKGIPKAGLLGVGLGAMELIPALMSGDRNAIASSGGSVAGGAIGAALGSFLGPIGTIAGGWLGSTVGEWLGTKLFGETEEERIAKRQKEIANSVLDFGDSEELKKAKASQSLFISDAHKEAERIKKEGTTGEPGFFSNALDVAGDVAQRSIIAGAVVKNAVVDPIVDTALSAVSPLGGLAASLFGTDNGEKGKGSIWKSLAKISPLGGLASMFFSSDEEKKGEENKVEENKEDKKGFWSKLGDIGVKSAGPLGLLLSGVKSVASTVWDFLGPSSAMAATLEDTEKFNKDQTKSTKTLLKTTDETHESVEKVEKGFFSKAWDGIKSFFRGDRPGGGVTDSALRQSDVNASMVSPQGAVNRAEVARRKNASNLRIPSSKELGALSANFESHGSSSAIGWDKKGGTSYGKYQIASATGTMSNYLRFLESKTDDANAQEVARRLRAAGAATDTGSRSGRAVDEWKALVSEGKMKDYEHEFIKSSHYDVTYRNLSPEVRAMVDKSKTLQDVLWSTSVQHGPHRGKDNRGATAIFNDVYKPGMTESQFIDAVYQRRTDVHGDTSRRYSEERQMAQAMLQNERNVSNSALAASSVMPPSTGADNAISRAISSFTQEEIARGVGYAYGIKGRGQNVDCSGFTTNYAKRLASLTDANGNRLFSDADIRLFESNSKGIVDNIARKTGVSIGRDQLTPDKIKENLVINTDDKHILTTYRDEATGKIMVAESSSESRGVSSRKGNMQGKDAGVKTYDYNIWYERHLGPNAKQHRVVKAADISLLTNKGAQFAPNTMLAENRPIASPTDTQINQELNSTVLAHSSTSTNRPQPSYEEKEKRRQSSVAYNGGVPNTRNVSSANAPVPSPIIMQQPNIESGVHEPRLYIFDPAVQKYVNEPDEKTMLQV